MSLWDCATGGNEMEEPGDISTAAGERSGRTTPTSKTKPVRPVSYLLRTDNIAF